MSWTVFDLETTTKSQYKRTADPFSEDNWVVMAGWCTQANPSPLSLYFHNKEEVNWRWLVDSLKDPGLKLLVGQNIKFDVLYACRDPEVYAAWMGYVARGGLVWDLQLAEYLMQGMIRESHMLSMDDLARIYNEDLKVDEVKKMWEAGIDTPDIPRELLTSYLVGQKLRNPDTGEVTGYREGDIGVTRNIFLKQLALARSSGMLRSIMMNMGSLCATIEMERNGMHVDSAIGEANREALAARLSTSEAELLQYLPKELPVEFNWSNRYHTSPLIFGGQIKYERRQYDLKDGTTTFTPPEFGDAKYVYTQKEELHYLMNDGSTLPCDSVDPHTDGGNLAINAQLYKSGKNAGEYKTKKVKGDDYTKPKGRMVDDYYPLPGFTKPKDAWKSETPGLFSVSSDVIEELTKNTSIPFLKLLGDVTSMSKDLGTYYWAEDKKGVRKGMLTLVRPNGLVHHSLIHTNTVTARFSSSNPNLQNIPKGNKSDAKQMFTSRYPAGYIIQSDFSSLEVYVQANLTGSKNLILDLLNKIDLHCMRLSYAEGMEYTEVVKLCKGWKEPKEDGTFIHHKAVEEWDYKRTGAKVFSFQRAYGAGVKTIAEATGLPVDEVEKLSDAEDMRYPEISEHFDKRAEEIERNAKPIPGLFVNHPCNPAIKINLRRSIIQLPSGKRYAYQSSPSMEYLYKKGIYQSFSPTERKNYEVQGEGGEVMKAAMWLAVREFYRARNFDGRALLVNTVHDAQYVDAHPDVRDSSARLLHACMEAATDFYSYWLQWDVPIAVPSDTVYGRNMGEELKFTDEQDSFLADAAELRMGIRARYMPGFTPKYMTLKDFE
jgi:DNA polymerase I-like protein with 3'-5' exonuclease and polymerase domains